MKKIFATLMLLGLGLIVLPAISNAQTNRNRQVYQDRNRQTQRVYRTNRNRNNADFVYENQRRGISAAERRRLIHQRYRLNRQRNHLSRDGVITRREALRYERSKQKYYNRVRRARNN